MASGKMTGVHIALIIFVMLTLITGVTAFMMYRTADERLTELNTSKSELNNQTTASRNRLEDIGALKTLLGASMEQVGRTGDNNPNTVVGYTQQQMATLAGPSAQPQVIATLTKMREEIDTLNREKAELQKNVNELTAYSQALEKRYADIASTDNKAMVAATTDLAKEQTKFEGQVKEVQDQLDRVMKAKADQEIEYEQYRDTKEGEIASLQADKDNLHNTLKNLTKELNDLRDVSFDVPDGHIISVSYDINRVWIDLGSDDKLREGTTFSVYNKDLATVGGRTSDIKATVQVVEVQGPHQSEAVITSEGKFEGDYSRPIARGDAVFSPLWRSGQTETFALVGEFDIDGDKIDDTDILITMIENAGGTVGLRIADGQVYNAEGEVVPADQEYHVTSQYKFLVLGDTGDPATVAGDEEAKLKIIKTNSLKKAEEEKAFENGLRIVTMNDFLSYMGYKPQRRLWRPGENIPWVLQNGSRKPSGNTESSGQVSGAFDKNRRMAR